ncbi:hypothetical protein ASPZODRAFT_24273 [Penicilliopsis zonata CBS 506.65]|uniref:RlpA-like protein double-psi beta-barrel domain-containing protein n=1 Tax=Penicilliopsis zonata CBS 506.65 TaxID=1073090 RepID=A0A1L9SNN1_9EURO|nr:hypothetical protein ASPZODRAFT_24273 [Penicilliopsis zonata CBS 506.65]OJJ48664.1 hypothetical protein ASPZODRAFT_24273 [Penicilliopsis zonata CBS 506.65]
MLSLLLLAHLAYSMPLPISLLTTHAGTGTVYTQDSVAGSCGTVHSDSDLIVAISTYWMKKGQASSSSSNTNSNTLCSQKISATNILTGTTVTVVVADTCAACGENDVDFSVGSWDALTGSAAWGTFALDWKFCGSGGCS